MADLVLLVGLVAGLLPRSADAAALRELTEADAAKWKGIYTPLLSPDGQWLAYLSAPAGSDGESAVILRAVHEDTERRYPAGDYGSGAGNLKMSPSGDWVAFQVAPDHAEPGQPIRLDVALIEVRSGARRDFKAIQSFDFIGGAAEGILLAGYPPREGGKTFDLTLRKLRGEEEKKIPGVVEFAANSPGTRVAWSGTDGVQTYDLRTGRTRVLDPDSESIHEELTWSRRGDALAMLRKRTAATALITFNELHKAKPRKAVFDAGELAGFPNDYGFAPSLRWREDERGVFFAIRRMPPAPMAVPTVPNLRVWHWRDELLPAARREQDSSPLTDWCFVDLTQRRFVRLADATLRDVELHDVARHVLAYDVSPYPWQHNNRATKEGEAGQIRDYYLVDLQTGQRKLLVRGLKVVSRLGLSIPPQLSPDGSIFLYQDNLGDVVAYDLSTGTQKNLSRQLPTQFYLPENEPKKNMGWQLTDPVGQGMPRVQGWTGDGRYALVSDYYDIWALPLRGGRTLNLTRDGRKENIWYRRIVLTEPARLRIHGSGSPVDLDAPIYFHAFDLDSGRQGLVRRIPGRETLEALHWEHADIRYLKAERADVYLYARMTAVESPDYFRIGADWSPEKRLTDINPQQREFRWSPGSKYLTYKTARGETRHAALHLPAAYVEGQAFPTIVVIYRHLSPTAFSYDPGSGPNSRPRFLQHGYAMVLPDIVPRLNEAGHAALEDVITAVDAAVATGIVDRARLGLFGFSYGGYETNFIVTQTDLFKAAVSWAGMTNLWSDCGGAYEDTWLSSSLCESSQPYLSGPWWEQWDAYLKNSPLYHAGNISTPLLLLHGDRDSAVPFSQSVELFSTLRRLGDKPIALLEYKGEGHDFSHAAQRDVHRRTLEFFDHFLKGAPAPKWWSDGISLYEGQVLAE